MSPSFTFLAIVLLANTLTAADRPAVKKCRCIPSLPCWPSHQEWQKDLNDTVSGQLILNQPVAISCYPGPEANPAECAHVDENYGSNDFQQLSPIGYSYPECLSCPPVNVSSGQQPTGGCSLGDAPVYSVNATKIEHIVAGIKFAQKHNIRLVVRDTGHDLLGRSTGFGSLQIWIRYLRTGITYHEQFVQEGSEWQGEAFTIGGGYVWRDVYSEAAKRGLLVIGGGTPSVGCLGGWMQGGGHSPATHKFGLGADQVLQAKVVLANGSVVTASPSQNQDLFFTIRGGGPGTYGVVVETTVKAWPTIPVVAQVLSFFPLDSNGRSAFLEALTDLYQAFPSITKAGWSGFGQWSTAGVVPIGNSSLGYAHTIATFNQSLKASKDSFAPVLASLRQYNDTRLAVSISYTELPTYAAFYKAFSGNEPPAGSTGARSGRFLDEKALTSNRTALRQTLEILAGKDDQGTVNVPEIFGAAYGQVAADAHVQPVSGLNPAWRSVIVNHIVARSWMYNTSQADVEDIQNDVLFVKGVALKTLAPHTGSYMNEANQMDPDYKVDFYGAHYGRLQRIKQEVDPDCTFYCPTCVGSDEWVVEKNGQLCRA